MSVPVCIGMLVCVSVLTCASVYYTCGDNSIRTRSKCLNGDNTTERRTRDRTTSNNLTVLSFPFLLWSLEICY